MKYTKEQQEVIDNINSLTQFEMCRLWRFAPSDHPYFGSNLPYYEIFKKRLDGLGWFTPEISKALSS